MSALTRWRLGALTVAALGLALFQWGPGLYRATRPQTTLWVRYAAGEWRDVTLLSGREQKVVSVPGDDPTDLLLVADVPAQPGSQLNDLASGLANAVGDSVLRRGTSTVDVMLMIDDGAKWPWQRPDYRSYKYHFGGEPASWKLVLYGGPAADRPRELTERWAQARTTS